MSVIRIFKFVTFLQQKGICIIFTFMMVIK